MLTALRREAEQAIGTEEAAHADVVPAEALEAGLQWGQEGDDGEKEDLGEEEGEHGERAQKVEARRARLVEPRVKERAEPLGIEKVLHSGLGEEELALGAHSEAGEAQPRVER